MGRSKGKKGAEVVISLAEVAGASDEVEATVEDGADACEAPSDSTPDSTEKAVDTSANDNGLENKPKKRRSRKGRTAKSRAAKENESPANESATGEITNASDDDSSAEVASEDRFDAAAMDASSAEDASDRSPYELSANEDERSEEELTHGTREMLRPDELRAESSRDQGASDAARQGLAAMVRQWEILKGVTDTITKNLSKVAEQMQEITLHSPMTPAIIERVPAPKITLLHRITLGVSAAALIIGLVGLSMTQSVREEFSRSRLQKLDAGALGRMENSSQEGVVAPTVERNFQKQNEKSSSAPYIASPRGSLPKNPPNSEPFESIRSSSELVKRQRELWRLRHGN